jgi:hypothetical protein
MAQRHPIQESPPLPLERRVQLLEIYLAQIWDFVWWLSLTPEQRADYEAQGFTAPIERFYEDDAPRGGEGA